MISFHQNKYNIIINKIEMYCCKNKVKIMCEESLTDNKHICPWQLTFTAVMQSQNPVCCGEIFQHSFQFVFWSSPRFEWEFSNGWAGRGSARRSTGGVEVRHNTYQQQDRNCTNAPLQGTDYSSVLPVHAHTLNYFAKFLKFFFNQNLEKLSFI